MHSRNGKVKNQTSMERKKAKSSRVLCKTVKVRRNGKIVMPINPMLPRNYSMEERAKLKDFERSVISSVKEG